MEIELRGVKGVIGFLVILLLAAGYFAYSYLKADKALTREAIIEAIDPLVQAYYVRQSLPGLQDAVRREDVKTFERLADGVTNVGYGTITVKGFFEPLVVRTEITVDGKVPRDGRSVRYFRIEYDELMKCWICAGRTALTLGEVNESAYNRRVCTRARWDPK